MVGGVAAPLVAARRMAGSEFLRSRWSRPCPSPARLVVALALVAAHRVVYARRLFGGLAAGRAQAPPGGGRSRGTARALLRDRRGHRRRRVFVVCAAARAPHARPGIVMRLAPGMTGQLEAATCADPARERDRRRRRRHALPPDARAEVRVGLGDLRRAQRPGRRTRAGASGGRPAAVHPQGPAAARDRGAGEHPLRRARGRADRRCRHEVGDPVRRDAARRSKSFCGARRRLQARTLHQCFDVLPIACQRRGYVGVELSLARTGEIREHSIAGSSYGSECPVNQCLADTVATWFFEPLPQSMTPGPAGSGPAHRQTVAVRLRAGRC